jgi:hypothetical protein
LAKWSTYHLNKVNTKLQTKIKRESSITNYGHKNAKKELFEISIHAEIAQKAFSVHCAVIITKILI